MKFIEDFCNAYVDDTEIYGYSAKNLSDSVSIYIMPMVNPDGVNIVTNYLSKKSWGYLKAKSISNNFPDISFPDGWKANIDGVDLKNYQPFYKVLYILVYKTLLVLFVL